MEERSGLVADYFVIAGLPENPELVDEDVCEGLNPNLQNIEPITDITVIFPTLGEVVPKGFSCVEKTPTGFPADLNSGSLRTPEVYLCYRRGRDKPPLVDIGVMYDGKERLLPDAEVVISTPEGRPANVNNTNARTLLTFRRAAENMPCNELVVTDVCVIMQNKGERPPHAFCLINKNLNKSLMGCDVFLCYKKSMYRPPLLSYKAEVLHRYPPIDRRGFPLPSLAAMFCLPMCATIECWPKIAIQPRIVFSTFVLTVADATEKIYGAATTFYEEYPEEKLTEEQREGLGISLPGDRSGKSVHVNKCICLLSHHPFFESFRAFLSYLHLMSRTGPHDVPIERYISHLLDEVPFPSPQRPHILMQLSPMQSVLMSHPHDSPLPKSGASFRQLLTSLGPDNCLMVLLLILTEQKLLIHSLRPDVLTSVAEAVSVIIFPFHWQCPYIPLCPLGLCAVLQAPVPFLVGVDSRFFDLYEPPSDVTCIDLDTNTITVSDDKKYILNTKLFPKKPSRILRSTLEMLQERAHSLGRPQAKIKGDASDVLDTLFQQRKRERTLELEIQEAFLRYMTSILKGYRNFLLPITKAPTIGATDASSLFDFQGFQRSRDKAHQKFYQMMLRTQMFFRFIEERSFVSDIDTGLAFFDECIDKIEQDDSETTRLLDCNEGNQSERTVFVMPPESVGLPVGATYSYDSVFSVQESRYAGIKPKANSLDRIMGQRNDQSAPGSPVARRTKQEIKSAQKNARKYSDKPRAWAKYLLSTCYSLWFIHLPSYVTVASSKHMALCMAYEMLVRMEKNRLQPFDEVCYRVVMQLCGLYSQPVVAVKVLFEMKKCGVTPNAITYGFYNKAVLEAQWPSNVSNSSQLMWNKLRNVIYGVSQFRAAGRQYSLRSRRLSHSLDEVDRLSTGSGGSLESQTQQQAKTSSQRLPTSSLSPQGAPVNNHTVDLGKSNSDSEANSTSTNTIPTRISSSSDIGYGSMNDQKVSSEADENEELLDKTAKSGKFWGKMGQSLDQWVKSGVSSLATVATLASDTSYYSPAGLIMSSYKGDYSGKDYDEEDVDDFDVKGVPVNTGKSHRKLDFDIDDKDESLTEDGKKNDTLRLLRSVSFGNDTQIMCKLKELKEVENAKSKKHETNEEKRSGSEESSVSLETKVNQYYEDPSRETSAGKSLSNSRETTPVDIEDDNQLTLRPESLLPLRSPSMQIKDQLRESTPSSPARTPVTQNDPLGALNELEITHSHNATQCGTGAALANIMSQNRDSPKRTCSEGQIGQMAAGNGNGVLMGPPDTPVKHFHRSSTLPNYTTTVGNLGSSGSTPTEDKMTACAGLGGGSTNVVSSLSAISSSLKNPFGRYSPGRLSLRKAGSSLIESTIGGKKAEALMEGFNQFKSVAAVTMKNKIEELKEVVGNNSPAGRNGPFGRLPDELRGSGEDLADWDGGEQNGDQWASVSESYLDQLLLTGDSGSTRASFASAEVNLGPSHHDTPLSSSTQSLFIDNVKSLTGPANRKDHPNPVAVEISMTTCSECHNCSSLLFDEEIMAGWTAEDSNLNTKCPHCNKLEVPFLEVRVKDFRHASLTLSSLLQNNLTNAPSLESMVSGANTSRRTSLLHPANTTTASSNPILQPVTKSPNTLSSKTESASSDQSNNRISKDVSDGNICSTSDVIEKSMDENINAPDKILNGDIQSLDPLGVMEEKSRRNSPEPIEPSAAAEVASTNNPTVSLTAPGEPSNVPSSNVQTAKVVEIEGIEADPIIVPYLSPLVLRKELENVLDHEGDSCLIQSRFVDEHPIIYWNLVWFFHRANLTSHIKGLSLQAKSLIPTKRVPIKKDTTEKVNECVEGDVAATIITEDSEPFSIHPSWEGADHRNVVIKCMWDNPKFHEQFGTPLYVQWLNNQNKSNRDPKTDDDKNTDNNTAKLMSNVLRAVQGNMLSQTCPQLLHHYHKQSRKRHYPTYRDILFLSLTAAGRESCDLSHRVVQNIQDGFGYDREYRDVYSKLNNDDYESMDLGDRPPTDNALFCRRFFRDLQL